MESIVTDNLDSCYICGRPREAIHHIFGGTANRKQSDKYKLVIPLCNEHHNMSNYSVHFNKELNLTIKKLGQEKFEEKYSREEFRKIFGRSYLW